MANLDAASSDFYDVFLSFRGSTRHGFTSYLYNALRRKGINAYRDDEELKTGDEIRPALLKAIEKSRMSMVVFCKDYASSTWCLEELVKIIDCYDNRGQLVLPIFYKVKPSDVRYQKESYKAAMIKHGSRLKKYPKKVEAWKSALSKVCELSGEHYKDDMYESGLVEKIVEETYAKLFPHGKTDSLAGHHDAASPDFKYDVFLSFGGETHYAFAGHLYNALLQNGICSFRDDGELRAGNEFRPAWLEAIEKSRISIVVLSENYASSTWCLDELIKIIECYETKKIQLVLPIFYKVEPSDVRHQKNSYEAAMIKHEKTFGQYSDKVIAWRSALSNVSCLRGELCRDYMSEHEFIKNIVHFISSKLPRVPLETRHLVGLDSLFQEVKSRIESDDAVCFLGVCGPGGLGKTTFAVYLYNKIRHQFEAASFLANVREKSNKSMHGLEYLQKTLLSEMGEETQAMMDNIDKGSFEIRRRLCHKKVLLVLDDVDTQRQLEALAGEGDWFGSGSKIIVTTRDAGVLDTHVMMHDVITEIYKMGKLNDHDSLELFCWYAFNMCRTAENFAEVSRHALKYARGNPLALRVIGSNLKGRSVKECKEELNKYEKVPDAMIQGVLEISYHSLFESDQEIFLDIACFFKGERWDYVQRILEACYFFPIIRVFVNKGLINIDEHGCLEMDSLTQDMGREIIRMESPSNPAKRSRLWSSEDILKILEENLGTERIEGIMLDPPREIKVKDWTNSAFEKMNNLRILVVRNTKFSTGPTYLPSALRLLDWEEYPSCCLPQSFYPKRIVDINLPRSCLTLWETQLDTTYGSLTFLNLSDCQSITQVPNFSRTSGLKTLTLDKCKNLVEFDDSVGFLRDLVYLSVSECTMLKNFVPKMYLPSLEMLSFNFCRRFVSFPHVVGKMDKPLKIHMMGTAIKEFPYSMSNITGLEYIDLSICRGLRHLSSSFLLLPRLVTLKIRRCSELAKSLKWFKDSYSVVSGCPNIKTLNFSQANLSDEGLLTIVENFPNLEDLNVSGNDVLSIPKCIRGSCYLKSIDVSYCRNLKEILELPLSIQKVDASHCRSLTSKSSSLLWSKVSEQTGRIQVVLPKTKIPKWFDRVGGEEDIPIFWARRKFPVVCLAFVFGKVDEMTSAYHHDLLLVDRQAVSLRLLVDGEEICYKDCNYFSVPEYHVLVCDVRVLFNDEEWQGPDAFLGDHWKTIEVQCKTDLMLRNWGVYVYRQETTMDDIKLRKSYVPFLVPTRTPPQRAIHMMEMFNSKEIFDQCVVQDESAYARDMMTFWMKANPEYECRASAYGASYKQEAKGSTSALLQFSETLPKQIIEEIAACPEFEQILEELYIGGEVASKKPEGQSVFDINMSIIVEDCPSTDSKEAPSRRYWGTLEIKHGDPTLEAVMEKFQQLWWGSWNMDRGFKMMVPVVLLKCCRPSTEEASSSSNYGESLEEDFHDRLLQALMWSIEKEVMESKSLNKACEKLKASIVVAEDDPIMGNPLLQAIVIMRQEKSGSESKNLPYRTLRVEHHALIKRFEQHNKRGKFLRCSCFLCCIFISFIIYFKVINV